MYAINENQKIRLFTSDYHVLKDLHQDHQGRS